jgi:hypothetical protein
MAQREVQTLVAMLDEAYAGHAWHGPCLRGSLRGITPQQAAWRPALGRHNIWEVAVHTAYWKYAVRRRLTGEKQGNFGEKGSNWYARPSASDGGKSYESAWRRDLALLAKMHRELCAAVLKLDGSELDRRVGHSRYTVRRSIAGIAMHDAYHSGQIQLLNRLRAKG